METRPTPGAPPVAAPPGSGRGSLDRLWIAVAVAVPAIASLPVALRMVDLAYHLRAGAVMLESGAILREEIFSFVGPGRPWLNQQWLAEVILGATDRLGGLAALAVLRAAMIGGIGAMLYLSCRARGADVRPAAWSSVAGLVVAFPALGLRPQLFGALLFVVTLWLLGRSVEHPRAVYALIPLGALWANLHGSFAFLPLLIGLQVVSTVVSRRAGAVRLGLVGLAATAATLVTPYGIDGWRYVVDLATNPVVRERITEWAPITLGNIFGWLFFGSAALVAAMLVRRGRPMPWPDLLWLGSFLAIAWSARRGLAWWGLVAAWIVAGWLAPARAPARERAGSRIFDTAIGLALVVAAVMLSPWMRGVSVEDAPTSLVFAVREETQPGARIFVPQHEASWFELVLPDRPVFVDSRIEQFPEHAWLDYGTLISGGDAWRSVASTWRLDAIVAEPFWPVVSRLADDPGWRLAHRDPDGVVFVRV